MIGLDAAGKTTILYQLKLGEVVNTIPTIGFNYEAVQISNITLNVWDVGGQNQLRNLWHHFYDNAEAIIFVIDSSDRERINEAKDEINNALRADNLQNAYLLVLANKQDLPNAMSPREVSEALELNKLKNAKWHCQGCCATTRDGMFEGFEWLSEKLRSKK